MGWRGGHERRVDEPLGLSLVVILQLGLVVVVVRLRLPFCFLGSCEVSVWK